MKMLLHCCCAPCGSGAVERLLQDGHQVTLFFSNSNIAPESEYYLRLESMKKLAIIYSLKLIIDQYEPDLWLNQVAQGFENEPEKGARCPRCFTFALNRTFQSSGDFDGFCTSLTISPHKNSKMIFECGRRFDKFVPYDFKKQNGFKLSCDLAAKYQLYRQCYCGCQFSMSK
ncbi:MAG: epoxyqueuosine reductase QueH [Victivallaceae bacterium]